MFESAVAVNEWQLRQFDNIIKDLSDDALFEPAAGHGHPPVWILGHLSIVGEQGQRMLGGTIAHIEWMRRFGPGSSDKIAADASLTRDLFRSLVPETYRKLGAMAKEAPSEIVTRAHGVELFAGSSLKTVGDLVTLLLTSHFSFHLGQLSSCRRASGHGPLF